MTVSKPTLPGAVYDALLKADPAIAADYNRAIENEPAAAVAVVINVNLDYEMTRSSYTDGRGRALGPTQYGIARLQQYEPETIASSVEAVRQAIARLMRGDQR